MDDPSGVQSALAIEAVEWEPAGGQNLMIRVRGRWRRRRPALRGQPLLVVEADGKRHRFPATPEPPSLAGAPPGSWQMSFSVPSWLAPHLSGRSWLQLGLAVVPLPPPSGPTAPGDELDGPDEEILADRRMLTAELAVQRERERRAEAEALVADLTARIESLEEELEDAEAEAEQLRAVTIELERARRAAEQREHAEHALRLELEERVDERSDDERSARAALGDLAESEERIRQLEVERDRLVARAADAERSASEAREAAARAAVEVAAAPGQTLAPGGRRFRELSDEIAAAAALIPAEPQVGRRPILPAPAESRALEGERALVQHRGALSAAEPRPTPEERELQETVDALRGELELRAAAEAHLRAELASARTTPAIPVVDSNELASVLGELRLELESLRDVVEHERVAREEAESRVSELERELQEQGIRSARVHDALAELRGLLEAVRSARGAPAPVMPSPPDALAETVEPEPPAASAEPEQPATPVEAERLDAARARLRETVPPPEAGDDPRAARPFKPWLQPVFRALTADDPHTAGRLLIGLLPAQGIVRPQPIAYDLRLSEDHDVRVTVAGDPPATTVERTREPRARAERSFWVEGDSAALARAVAAGGLRRRFGRRMARVEGDRSGFAAVRELVRAPLGLEQLVDAGVRLDPELAFTLAAWMIDPRWAGDDRFTIAHTAAGADTATYLHVRRSERATVTSSPPLWDIAARIVCVDERVLGVLAGRRGADVHIEGDERALGLVIGWLDHAQRR